MRDRVLAFGLLLVTMTAGLSVAASPASASNEWLFPDLVPSRVARPMFTTEQINGELKMLLRFDSFIHNVGPGPLEFVGSDPAEVGGTRQMTQVHQRVYRKADRSGLARSLPMRAGQRIVFETSAAHRHWHFGNAERYVLVGPDGAETDAMSPKESAGFCFTDDERIDAWAPEVPLFPFDFNRGCEKDNPSAQTVEMGVSPGWVDFYSLDLDYQWLDVSNTRPRSYAIRAVPDPDNLIVEANETNNADPRQDLMVVVPGFEAKSSQATVQPLGSTTIALAFDAFESNALGGELGEPEFQVIDGPNSGTLNRASGEWFRGGSVAYTPNIQFRGDDSFSFVVRDSRRGDFPRSPRVATVRLESAVALPHRPEPSTD